ncbi:MAG: Clp protease N-terminal domain-containing protein [Planctomycetota bacterium]|nr:Clp protease N-terminal domain-containing protein [Planctomycetota bacterium]
MTSVEELERRQCTKGLIQIIDQLPARFAVRSPIIIDDDSLLAVALWTMLRWERTPLMVGLEDMGVDVWALTREVDTLLDGRRRTGNRLLMMNVVVHQSPAMLDQHINRLLDKVQVESHTLGHDYLGAEHLLLAIIANADLGLFALLSRCGVTKERVTALVRQPLRNNFPPVEKMPDFAVRRRRPRRESFSFTSWDSEAAGVPRRFGMSIMFMMMTMYAVLFAFMKVMGTPTIVFAIIAIFVTGVGFAQMALFGGRYPRAASIWGGAVLFPLEIAVLVIALGVIGSGRTISQSIAEAIGYAIPCALAGAFFGYLSGGLTAGAFLLIDMFGPKNPPPEAEIVTDVELVPEDETPDNSE